MNPSFPPPSIRIHTIFFHPEDRTLCRQLGESIYALLTRPPDQAPGYGPKLQVSVALHYESVGEVIPGVDFMIPVLGPGAATFPKAGKAARRWMADTHQSLGGQVDAMAAVFVGALWRSARQDLRPYAGLIDFPSSGSIQVRIRRVTGEIVRRLVKARSRNVKILISFDPADSVSRSIASGVEAAVAGFNHQSSFGRDSWLVMLSSESRSLADQMEQGSSDTVVMAIRGDRRSRHQLERELLRAKLLRLPIVLVDASARTADAEVQSPIYVDPYGGNVNRIRWNSDIDATLQSVMVEWLSAAHFRSEANRLKTMVRADAGEQGWPVEKAEVVIRRPELTDVAHWWRRHDDVRVLMHPDPELPAHDRELLRNAYPRVRFVTPSTLYRDSGAGGSTFPLADIEVAMSVSDVDDFDETTGMTAEHLRDAYHATARTLLASGATLSYAGDFRDKGHMQQLIELVNAYNMSSTTASELVNAYLPVDLERPKRYPVRTRSMRDDPELSAHRTVSFDPKWPAWLYRSDLRRAMALTTDARLVVGGNALPAGSDRRPGHGYVGPLPGIVEEAFRTLEAGAPLFIVGGFGGAARLVVHALKGQTPKELRVETFEENERFMQRARDLRNAVEGRFEVPTPPGLPPSLNALAARLYDLGREYFGESDDHVANNGLTLAQNRILWSTRDPALVAALVMQGLLKRRSQAEAGAWRVELVHGDWTSAIELDACLILAEGDSDKALMSSLQGQSEWQKSAMVFPAIDAAEVAVLKFENIEVSSKSRFDAAFDVIGRLRHRHDLRRVGIVMPSMARDLMWASLADGIKRTLAMGVTTVILDRSEDRLARLEEAFAQDDQIIARRTRKRLSIV